RVGRGDGVEGAIAAAIGVDLGLRQRVLRGIAPGLDNIELAVRVGVAADIFDAAGIRVRVGHRHAGQRLVAGVLHRDRVVELLAQIGGASCRERVFVSVGGGVLRNRYRCIGGVGAGLVRVGVVGGVDWCIAGREWVG